MMPLSLGGELTHRAVRAARRAATGSVDRLRRLGRGVAMVATDLFAFGDAVPAAYVDFVDQMLSDTPFEVVAEFFPSFRTLDKFHAVAALGSVPTAIICGTARPAHLDRAQPQAARQHPRLDAAGVREAPGTW